MKALCWLFRVPRAVHPRPALDIVFRGDGARGAAPIPPIAPEHLTLYHSLLQTFLGGVAVDGEEDERLALEPFDERPLVGYLGHTGAAPGPPERKHNDL